MTETVTTAPQGANGCERAEPLPPAARREEDAELVRVRGLLCELRPDPGGPLGWGPYDEAPPPPPEVTDEGRSIPGPLASRVRVQTSPDPSPIPKDAFGGRAPLSGGRKVAERIHELGRLGLVNDAVHTLNWLQRHGTLARGLGELYRAVGQALATAEQRERWGVSKAAALDGPRLVGRRRVSEAMRVWWGETNDDAQVGGKEGA